jgi:hypothetical protein
MHLISLLSFVVLYKLEAYFLINKKGMKASDVYVESGV